MFRKLILSAIIPALIFQSCHFGDLDYDKIEIAPINSTLGLKVGEATYTIRELLVDLENESISIVEGEDFSLKIITEKSMTFSNNENIIQIETIKNTSKYKIPVDVPALGVEQTVPFSTIFNFQFDSNDGEQIDSVYFSGGDLEYHMLSSFPASVDYSWIIVKTKEVSTQLDLTQSKFLNYTGKPVKDSFNRPLLGLKTLMYRLNDQNQFNVDLNGDFIVPAGQGLTTAQSLDFDLSYVNPTFSKIYGYFGKQKLDVEGVSVDMSSFSEFLGEGINFSNPSITLDIVNSYGIEMLLNFDEIKAIYADESILEMQEILAPKNKLVKASAKIGESATSQIVLNANNSNLVDLINGIPKRMDFNIGVEANPDVSTLTSNFLSDQSSIEVKAKIEVPFQFKMDGFETDFEFDSKDLIDEKIKTLDIQMTITNEIPINGKIFLDFMDDNGQYLSTMDKYFLIKSPSIGSDGRTSSPERSISKIKLDELDIQHLINSSKIRVRLQISTFESDQNKDVNLYADYELKIEMALVSDVNIVL